LAQVANDLLDAVDLREGVRLLGVGVGNLVDPPPQQLDLLSGDVVPDEVEAAKRSATGAAVAAIRDKFGDNAVAPATLVDREGIRRRRFGQQQWGPDERPDSPKPPAGTETR
jgi:hypothetical protein